MFFTEHLRNYEYYSYHARRARQENRMAKQAHCPNARQSHRQLAAHHEAAAAREADSL